MNYREIENLFRQEQLELSDQLQLNASAVDLSRLRRDWLSVRITVIGHRIGGTIGYLLAGVLLTLAYLNPGDVYLYGPFLMAAAALLINGAFFPVRKPPMADLERFSTTELANELAGFQHYANRRIPFDSVVGLLVMGALAIWRVHSTWAINPLTDFDRIGPVVRAQIAFVLTLPVLGGLLINYLSNRKLRRLEERLRGYFKEELV